MNQEHDETPTARLPEHFQEAIAQHQLELQLELKKTTSLPSAMFDAADSMLEARLCEATDSIFRHLLDLAPPDELTKDEQERILEQVARDEVQHILQCAREGRFDSERPDIEEGAGSVYRGVLQAIAAQATGAVRQAAIARLQQLEAER
jgi:hypothetical protein